MDLNRVSNLVCECGHIMALSDDRLEVYCMNGYCEHQLEGYKVPGVVFVDLEKVDE